MIDDTNDERDWLSADEAAAHLGVKKETVYAYVSRGMLSRHRAPGQRQSFFRTTEVEQLASRGRTGSSDSGSAHTFVSSISAIRDDQLYIRGRNVASLAKAHLFEEVANFIWTGALKDLDEEHQFEPDPGLVSTFRDVLGLLPPDLLPAEQIRCLIPVAGALDPMRHDLEAIPLQRAARRLIASVIEALPVRTGGLDGRTIQLDDRQVQGATIATQLWSRLAATTPTDAMLRALNATLVVTADHSASSHSTAVARLAASRRATIYSIIGAALESGGGPIRASASLEIEHYLRNINKNAGVTGMLNQRLLYGHELPGFGHRSYTKDPRAPIILELMSEDSEPSERLDQIDELLAIQHRRGLPPPNIGFAIAMLTYVADMLPGSAEVIFFISRAAGWVGHALEQLPSGDTIRQLPSIYIGPELRND